MELWYRALASLRRRRLERDLDDEVAFHLAMREQDVAAAGGSPVGARVEARRRFGNPTALKEQMRDVWTFSSLESIWQDVRYACRALRRSPGFASIAILALAIGIGGNTAIFTLVNAVRAQALPFKDPSGLVALIGNVRRQSVQRSGVLAGGIFLGAAGAIVVHRFVATLFYDVAVADASALVAVSILALVACMACVVPALRAARIDPIEALRCE
jgi:hypothetical protein